MAYMLDTSIAIPLRDGDTTIAERMRGDDAYVLSIVTRVELEGGVYRDPALQTIRRQRLDVMLEAIPTVAFDVACVDAYVAIIAQTGYSRRKLLDRMIAAQALVHRLTLVTRNLSDFSDVPGLRVEPW
jgi:predicted nucleic acid-binding protein